MIDLQDRPVTPATYQEWLDCFSRIRELPLSADGELEALERGSFTGTGAMQAALERQLVDTVNVLLNKSVKRFVRDLNECIAFNELAQIDILFKRLRRDIHKAMFFLKLPFLSGDFKAELYRSVTRQMTDYWNNTISFLRQQAAEHPDPDLEDALFLIGRIRLFSS